MDNKGRFMEDLILKAVRGKFQLNLPNTEKLRIVTIENIIPIPLSGPEVIGFSFIDNEVCVIYDIIQIISLDFLNNDFIIPVSKNNQLFVRTNIAGITVGLLVDEIEGFLWKKIDRAVISVDQIQLPEDFRMDENIGFIKNEVTNFYLDNAIFKTGNR